MKKVLAMTLLCAACGKSAMSVDDLVQKSESLAAGTKVTVQAVSWGTNSLTTGGKRLNLGAKPLEGMKQAPVVADWEAKDAAKLPALAKNASVKLECTLDEGGYGQVHLKDCTVL